jgi:hypothetical protein
MLVNIDQIDLSWQIEWQNEQHEKLLELEDQEEEIEPLNYYDNDQDFEIEL